MSANRRNERSALEKKIEHDASLLSLSRTLTEMRTFEKIPAAQQRAAIRARLLESLQETNLAVV